MSEDKSDDVPSESPEQPEAKTRKLKITKRVVRHFSVRSGLMTGRPYEDTADVDGYRMEAAYIPSYSME